MFQKRWISESWRKRKFLRVRERVCVYACAHCKGVLLYTRPLRAWHFKGQCYRSWFRTCDSVMLCDVHWCVLTFWTAHSCTSCGRNLPRCIYFCKMCAFPESTSSRGTWVTDKWEENMRGHEQRIQSQRLNPVVCFMEIASIPSLESVLFLKNGDGAGNLRVAARTFLRVCCQLLGPVEISYPYLPEDLDRQTNAEWNVH